jgi:hypothetical protein
LETDLTQSNRRKKWIVAIVAAVVILILVTLSLINFAAEPYLSDRLKSEFENVSDGDATLEIADLNIGVFPPSVTIEGVSLSLGPDASNRLEGHPVLNSTIARASIYGVSLWDIAFQDDLEIREVIISGANIHVSRGLTERFKSTQESGNSSRNVLISSFRLDDSSLAMHREDLSDIQSRVSGVNISVNQLDLSSGERPASERLESVIADIDSISHTTDDAFYTAEAYRMTFNSETGLIAADGFNLTPLLSAQEMPAEIGHETDHLDIQTGRIELTHFETEAWLNDQRIIAEHLTILEPRIQISRDKNPPDKPVSPRPLFNSVFANLPTLVSIDTLNIRKGYISYREWQAAQDTSGTVFFDSVEVEMTNLQNMNQNEIINAKATSQFMNLAELSVQFEFTLFDNGAQTITGEMGKVDLTELNPVLAPLAFVRIDRGELQSLEFDFTLNDTASRGTFRSNYENFSMSLLSKDDLESNSGRRILSFLANNLQIHSSNGGVDPRVGEISFEREEGQSTVNYWWKSLRSGIKDLIQRI